MKTYNGFDLSQEDKSNLNAITTAFNRCAIGETNEILERYLFNKREQKEGESIDQYVAKLRNVVGIKDCGAHKRLLQQQQLTLQWCIDICKTSEDSNTQSKSLGHSVKEEV